MQARTLSYFQCLVPPNMPGYFSLRKDAGFAPESYASGSFFVGEKYSGYMALDIPKAGHYMNFDPSLVAAEYVDGASVQQASLQCLCCIKA